MKKPPADKIRGSLQPFIDELSPLLQNALTNNGFDRFREHLKDSIARRMQHTLYVPIDIPEPCIDLIETYFRFFDHYIYAFIRCSLLYYTNRKPHCTTKLNFSCSSCSSKEHKKSVTHAVQDCKKCGNHYLNSIEKKATCINCQNLAFIKSKTKATKKAISFVSEYIDALLQRELPYNISDKVYNMVFSHDHNIQTLYKCNAHNGTYRIKNKGTYYNEIDKILATHIFCALFTTKKL